MRYHYMDDSVNNHIFYVSDGSHSIADLQNDIDNNIMF